MLFPTPKERLIELVAPTHFKAVLEEPAVAVDPTSGQKAEQLPTYNAYSIDGDVTAPLVYVNYGRPEDYEELDRTGVSVRGAIVIVRYGGSFRGTKPKIAAEHGAVGCLIYSDPRDDGYFVDDVFPEWSDAQPQGVAAGQRAGSAGLPGRSADAGDRRGPGREAAGHQARRRRSRRFRCCRFRMATRSRCSRRCSGPVAPVAWRGALPITYRVGPGPARVHLKVASNWDIKPLYDVVARITGSTFPDEWIVRGNHHDAWVNGAADPISGMAPMLEEARAIGELVKQGWRPKRTIVYAAWDGEEPGLLGSTEWVEQHDEELQQKAVLYINSDGNGRGFLRACRLAHARALRQRGRPERPGSGDEGHRLEALAGATDCECRRRSARRERDRAPICASARWDRVGLHAVSAARRHRVAEPVVRRHGRRRHLSLGVRRLLPLSRNSPTRDSCTAARWRRPSGTAVDPACRRRSAAVRVHEPRRHGSQTYVKELQKLLKQQQDETRERNRQIEDGVFAAINDPTAPAPGAGTSKRFRPR